MATVKLEGFKELDRALAELPKATAKNTAVRALKKAAKPIDDDASAAAPFLSGKLEHSVVTGTRLTRSQKATATFGPGGFRLAAKNYAEIHIGTSLSRGMFQEFGTFKDDPQPWFRPAWETNKMQVPVTIGKELWAEIEKSAKRHARKLAKGAA